PWGAPPAAPRGMGWYATGRRLLWLAGLAVLTPAAARVTLGTDTVGIAAAMKRGFLRILGPRDAAATADLERVIDAFVTVAPAAAALVAMLTLTINLWLAGKITKTSGRLHRSWPDLRATALPPMTLVALCVAIALAFTGGLVAMLAQIVSAALLAAFALTGFPVL